MGLRTERTFMRSSAVLIIWLTLGMPIGMAIAQDQPKTEEPEKHYLYEWTDESEIVHVTDNPLSVPQQYRNSVRIREQLSADKQEGRGQSAVAAPSTAPPHRGADDDKLKTMWQQRMRATQIRRNEADVRYRRLVHERERLQEQWGYGLYGYSAEVSRQLEQLELQINQAKGARDDAEEQLNVTIPEEARKEGIPPGWLRE